MTPGLPGRHRNTPAVNVRASIFFAYTLVHVLLSSFSQISQAFRHSPRSSTRTASSPSWSRGRLRPSGVQEFGAVASRSDVKLSSFGGSGGCGDADVGRQRNQGREPGLSITTFNVLAPIFKRVGAGRESEFRDSYLDRHSAILEHLKVCSSEAFCLMRCRQFGCLDSLSWLKSTRLTCTLHAYHSIIRPNTSSRVLWLSL